MGKIKVLGSILKNKIYFFKSLNLKPVKFYEISKSPHPKKGFDRLALGNPILIGDVG